MKTTLQLFGLALIIILSSCSSDMLIVKRKYNKGYYVSTGGKVKHQESTQIKDEGKPNENEVVSEEVTGSEEMPITASVDNTPELIQTQNLSRVTEQSASEQAAPVLSKKEQKQQSRLQKKETKRGARSEKKSRTGGDVDSNTILLIILAIIPILSLVAMYLKDGKQITLNFWVNLLLHFIALWWLFGILVVLDVIDLS